MGIDHYWTSTSDMKHAGCYNSKVCRDCIGPNETKGVSQDVESIAENKRRKTYAIALSIVGIVVSLVYICLHYYAYDRDLTLSDQSLQYILIIIHMLLIIYGAYAVSQRFKRCFNYTWTQKNPYKIYG